MADQKKEIVSLLTALAGGAVAGYVDVKYATKKLGGLGPGAVGGLGLAAAGLFGSKLGLSSKITDVCLDGATGMLAFEAGTLVAQKTLAKMLPPPAVAGVSGLRGGNVGRMNPAQGRPDFMAQLASIESAYSHAA